MIRSEPDVGPSLLTSFVIAKQVATSSQAIAKFLTCSHLNTKVTKVLSPSSSRRDDQWKQMQDKCKHTGQDSVRVGVL